jgi:4-amino-4-deoxy-L-arabinose transferase-like glycosyltransferase
LHQPTYMNAYLRQPRVLVPVLLGAFVLLAIAYSITVPLGEAPDEVSHFAYIQYLLTHHELPPAEGAAAGESHQPPLYYFIGALSTTWIPVSDWQVIANPDYVLDDPQTPNLLVHTRQEAFPYQGSTLAWHLVRLLSVVMGAITVWATWRIALILLGDDEWLAFGAAAFVAFLPEFTFISGMVNNDNLVVMLSSLSVLQILRMRDSIWSKRDSIILGLLIGLAALTKLSGLVLWAFALFVYSYRGLRSRRIGMAGLHSTLCLGTATLIASPWFAYNLIQFGDPLGWSKVIALSPPRQAAMGFSDWLSLVQGLFTSFAGRFGGALQLKLAEPYYWAFGFGILLALLGWIGYARDLREGRFSNRTRDSLLIFSLFWLLMLIAFVRWTTTVLGTDQARQLFPGLPLLSIFLITGLARFARGNAKSATVALSVMGLALTIAILFYLNGLYAPQPSFAQFDTAQSHTDFGQTIRILDYRLARTSVKPGELISVQVDWQALKEPREDYWLLLQLLGPGGAVAYKDGIPSGGLRTTDWWQVGELHSSRHTLLIPADVKPGTYMLALGLHPYGRWDWLRVNGQDGFPLGEIQVMPLPGG